jgi:MoxR-like ATPase
MSPIHTSAVFKHTCALFPSIGAGGRVQIPAEAASKIEPATRMRLVPWGALEAACAVLLGRVEVSLQGDEVRVQAMNKDGVQLFATRRDAGQFSWVNPGSVVRPYVLLLAEAVFFGVHAELGARWAELLAAIRLAGASFPLSESRLAALSSDHRVKQHMYRVLDSLYYTGKGATRAVLSEDLQAPATWTHSPVMVGERARVSAAVSPGLDLTEEGRLTRRAAYGIRALLVGPTGCGKTEMGKRVILATGATLVSLKGRPGLEDRDMIGFISPTAQGPRWVDGPLARAMRLAQEGTRTALLIDELLRLDAYHRNALIGMLDDVSAPELRAQLGVDVPDGRYYTLELPGAGEVLWAPTSLLSVICTTNAGGAYTQSGDLDPALLRRFQRVMFVSHPEEADILPVYERACCVGTARVAYALEVATRGMTTSQGQVLARPMNIGVTLNYLAEVRDLLRAGLGEVEALREALQVTVVPFCCELTEDGLPDPAAVKALSTTLEGFFRQGLLRKAA